MKIRFYLYRLLITKTTAIAAGLVLIFWIVRSLNLLDTIVSKGVNLIDFLQLSAYLLPYILYTILPFALVIGTLIVYRLLDADNELLVMRLSGVSKARLARPFLEVFTAFAIIGLLISAYLIPSSYNKFQQIVFRYQTHYLATFIEDKSFNSDISGITFYIDNKSDTNFEGVFINDHRNPGKTTTIFAESGQLSASEGSPAFILHKGIQFEHDLDKNVTTTLKFETYNLRFDYNNAIKQIKNVEHQELTIRELLSTSADHKAFNELRAEGMKRILWPTLSIFAPLILLAALLNEKFSRKMRYGPPAIAISASFLMILINSYASSIAHNNWIFMLIIFLFNIIVGIIALFFTIQEKIKG